MKKYIYIILFLLLSICVIGKSRENFSKKIPLQENTTVELIVKGNSVKQKYKIRFSTEEKRNNFKILSIEKNIEI